MSETNPENKLVISAALCGAVTNKAQNPNVPYTAEEFGNEAKKCYDEGAAIVHIHARHPEKGNPTPDLDIIKSVLENIKSKAPDIIINLSSAIRIFKIVVSTSGSVYLILGIFSIPRLLK